MMIMRERLQDGALPRSVIGSGQDMERYPFDITGLGSWRAGEE